MRTVYPAGARAQGFNAIAQKTKITDLLYCIFLFVVVFMSTIGMGASDNAYMVAVALGGLFALVRVFTEDFSPRYFLLLMVLVALAAISFVVAKRFTLLLTVLLLAGARGIDTRVLLSTFFAAKLSGLLIIAVFVATGVYQVEFYEVYKTATESFMQRVKINGTKGATMHMSFLAVIFLYLYLRKGKTGIFSYIFLAALDLLIGQVTNSFIGIFLGMGGLGLFFLLQHGDKIRRWFVKYSVFALPVVLLFSFGTAFLYGKVPFVNTLDRILQGRIYYNHYFLSNYSASPIGHGMLSAEGNFDNSFVFVFVAYGFVVFLLLFGAVQKTISNLKKGDDWLGLALVVVYLIAGVSESFYPAAAINPSLFLLVPLMDSFALKAGVGNRARNARNRKATLEADCA